MFELDFKDGHMITDIIITLEFEQDSIPYYLGNWSNNQDGIIDWIRSGVSSGWSEESHSCSTDYYTRNLEDFVQGGHDDYIFVDRFFKSHNVKLVEIAFSGTPQFLRNGE